tara:strand:- start:9410 stop:10114 length:705 start_codon:yes stop_codon:yes gene_type:complete
MRIQNYLNTTEKEVADKKHNIWIGISLGNNYFTKENIEEYIRWAFENTKEKALVVIGDSIQAINIEVLDSKNKGQAFRRAMKLGDKKYLEIQEIFAENPYLKEKVSVVRWNEINSNPTYQKRLAFVSEAFLKNKNFHDCIINIVKLGRKDREEKIAKLSDKELDRLAEYILQEIPHFVDGVQGYDEHTYTLIPYPGLTMLDQLFVGLNNKALYPELVEKLNIQNKIAIVEAYIN